MEARQVAGEAVRGPAEGVIGVVRRRPAVGTASVGGQKRLEVAVGDERLDLVAVASAVAPVTGSDRRDRARRCAGRGG